MSIETTQNQTKTKQKKDILSFLAYILYIYMTFTICIFVFLTFDVMSDTESNPIKHLLSYFTIEVILSVMFLIGAVVFFRLVVPGKKMGIHSSIFGGVFIAVNLIWVLWNSWDLIGIPINNIGWFMFIGDAGYSIVGIILAVMFMKKSGEESTLIKIIGNKWVLFSGLIVSFLLFIYHTGIYIRQFSESYRYARQLNMLSKFFEGLQNNELMETMRFPYLRVFTLFFFTLAVIIFAVNLAGKTNMKKGGRAVVYICILLLMWVIIDGTIGSIIGDNFHYYYLPGVLIVPFYAPIIAACLMIAVFRECISRGADLQTDVDLNG